MTQKFEEKKAKLYIDALNDECLPIVCAVDKFYEFLFHVAATREEADRYGIKNRIDKHLRGDYLTGLKNLLEGVVENVLNTTTDVVEENQTHVVYANESVLRIDYFLYFTKFKVGSNDMTALFYYVQVGVIDMTRVRLPVLRYELTRATDKDKLKNAGENLQKMADSSLDLHIALETLARNAALQQRNESPPGNPPFSERQQGGAAPKGT